MPPEGSPAPEPAENPEVEGAEGAAPEQAENEGGGGLYDLDSVPQELREHLQPHLKAIEGNVTRKFQEYSEKLKPWEPYEELGLRDIPPEQVQQLLDFAELAQDQEKFAEWWKGVGEQLGLTESLTKPDDEFDFDDDELEGLTPEKVQELVEKQVAERVTPLIQQQEAQREAQAEAEAMQEIQGKLSTLAEGYDGELDTDAVLQLAYAYLDDDPENAIERGFEDFKRLVGAGEARLLAEKTKQPQTPEPGGAADTSAPRITTFEDAKAAAKERFKANANA